MEPTFVKNMVKEEEEEEEVEFCSVQSYFEHDNQKPDQDPQTNFYC